MVADNPNIEIPPLERTNFMFRIENGNKVKCIITGFKGIVTARVEYFNGCIQYNVQPGVDKDGTHSKGRYIDEAQLEIIKGGVSRKSRGIDGAGGPMHENTPSENYEG